MKGLGLTVLLIGIRGAIATADMMCVIVSMVIGIAIGELINIENRLERLGDFTRRKLGASPLANAIGETFTEGFVTASLLYCTGAMAIVGSMEGGLYGSHSTLLAKALLDGITSMFFASTLGIGVLFSAIPVFAYQGLIVMTARFVAPLLTDEIIREMSAVGGLLIAAIGLNLTQVGKLRAGNMIPATFIPLIYLPIAALLK